MKLTLKNVSKEFFSLRGRVRALRTLDLEIEDGEFYVLLGPSGSGKSTLLNLIAGLEKPTTGQIYFGDQPVADAQRRLFASTGQRNVAFVFQSYALYPHMDVRRNIAFPLKIARWKKPDIERAVQQAAETLSITELLSARPRELSGGQRQRVAIARAIVRRPSLFLLDEPLSNLDAQLRGTMRAELKRLQRQLGITAIYVTHDQVEAMSLGDRVAVLRGGELQQSAPPHELYEKPASPFVAGFIGSPPANVLTATLGQEQGRRVLKVSGGSFALSGEVDRRAQAAADADGRLLVAVRPEHVLLTPSAEDSQVETEVLSVEPLGRETVVRLQAGRDIITTVLAEADFRQGQQLPISFSLGNAHFYAPSPEALGSSQGG